VLIFELDLWGERVAQAKVVIIHHNFTDFENALGQLRMVRAQPLPGQVEP
jgi:hypothetical protein